MDRDLIAFSYSTHQRWMIRGGMTKRLLRLAVDEISPSIVNWRRTRTVFNSAHRREGEIIATSD
ncbi:MAG: hypothetical protein ACK2T7_14950, partial [Anaerolineales bacterium]